MTQHVSDVDAVTSALVTVASNPSAACRVLT